MEASKKLPDGKDERPASGAQLALAAMGLEAEFTLELDGRSVRPEALFGDPRAFMGNRLMHRTGTSYHLPNGGAVYFDTGVIEVATPVIEIEPGCAARSGRSLWEAILQVRESLDRWERRRGRDVRLVGFSTHYNVSFEHPPGPRAPGRTVEALAYLLTHLLPVPVMLLAANRRSTGIGVRPRGDRIEVTADFTPSPALMIATATFIVGVVREVMTWPSYEVEALDRQGVPRIHGFRPRPHSSRKGWVARPDGFARNPFEADVDAPVWETADGRTMSLRGIAGRITRRFWRPIRRISDPFTFRMIGSVMRGRAPSLLDLDDRPPEYEDVGRLCTWDNLFPEEELSRSRYERVLIRAIAGRRLSMDGRRYVPVGMRGWAEVVFRDARNGSFRVVGIDSLLRHLDDW
jgi:hypothetical protein